jgi:hypothetical protein
MGARTVEFTGGCRCGHLQYRLVGPLGPVANCHCVFCRRVHGAAFTTVAFVPPDAFAWLGPPEAASRYQTPLGAVRHFCGRCASPIFNFSPVLELGAVVTQSLHGAQPAPWVHVNVESKVPWLALADGLPQFPAWPSPAELRELLRAHPGAWVPERLLGEAAP